MSYRFDHTDNDLYFTRYKEEEGRATLEVFLHTPTGCVWDWNMSIMPANREESDEAFEKRIEYMGIRDLAAEEEADPETKSLIQKINADHAAEFLLEPGDGFLGTYVSGLHFAKNGTLAKELKIYIHGGREEGGQIQAGGFLDF